MNKENNSEVSQQRKTITAKDWEKRRSEMSVKEWQMRINITDETGATRHFMTLYELGKLYKAIEEFEADLTRDEYTPHSNTFAEMKGLLYKRMQLATKKIQGI